MAVSKDIFMLPFSKDAVPIECFKAIDIGSASSPLYHVHSKDAVNLFARFGRVTLLNVIGQ